MSAVILPHPNRPNDPNWFIMAGFGSNSHLLPQLHREYLRAKVLPRGRSCWVHLRGLASRLGSADANRALSNRRAHAVSNHLLSLGFPSGRITAVAAVGEEWSRGGPQTDLPEWRGVEVIVTDSAAPPPGRRTVRPPDPTTPEPPPQDPNPLLALLNELMYYPSRWKITGSAGVDGSITVPLPPPILQVGAAWNNLYLREEGGGRQVDLGMGGLGGGLSTPGVLPGSLEFSTPSFPSDGIGYVYSRGGRRLDPADFEGFFVQHTLQLGLGGGSVAGSLVVLGLPLPPVGPLQMTIMLARAVGLYYGLSAGAVAQSVGWMTYFGIAEAFGPV